MVLGILSLQTTFNTERRQGLGVATTLHPLADRQESEEKRKRFLLRHMESFNTNPVLAGALLGAIARLEEEGLAGSREAQARAMKTKAALEAPLAAIGDAFMWDGLRPVALLLGSLLFHPFGVIWGPVVILALYNLIHLGLRTGGFLRYYNQPDRVHELVRAGWLRWVILVAPWLFGGWLVTFSFFVFYGPPGAPLGPVGLGLAAMILGWILGRRGFTRGAILAAGGMIVGLVFAALV